MTIEQAFGKAIRRLRKERELSQDALSLTSQLDRTFISLIECGKKNPTLITIFQLSRGLNVTTERILREVEMIMLINGDTQLAPATLPEKGLPHKDDSPALEKLLSTLPRARKEAILLVEDEEVTREYVSLLLQRAGFDIIVASNGNEAVEFYKKRQKDIRLVIMDVVLPECNGIDAVGAILKLNPQARIIFISGYERQSLNGIPAHLPFLQKPMDPLAFVSQIQQSLES